MLDLISLGECMVELYCDGSISRAAHFYKAYGGDTLNTAVAASRLGSRTGYISKLGSDPFLPFLLEELTREEIDLECCPVVQGFNGLYLISLGEKGEREFTYYRAGSAASTLSPGDLDPAYIRNARILHASGISQAISSSCRNAVRRAFALARDFGVRTSYDPNFRRKLWSAEEAKAALEEVLPLTDIFLPSSPEDSQQLLQATDAGEIYDCARKKGPEIIVIKKGEAGCVVAAGGELRSVESFRNAMPVDTSGAGDAFNGGFLHGLLCGLDPVEAARLGVTAAGIKIAGRGAVRSLPQRRMVEEAVQGEAWASRIFNASSPSKGKTVSQNKLVAFIDGGSRGNPGPAGVGILLYLDDRRWRGLYEYLGKQTNNYAEYSALLVALNYALKEGFRRLEVYSDSELLVRQVLGKYRVKNPALQTLHRQVSEMVQRLDRFSIQHVPREKNRMADALANKALDLRSSGEEHYRS